MPTLKEYSLMASAAYDERRLVDDSRKIASLEELLQESGWARVLASAFDPSAAEDDATFSDPGTGMQADVWRKGSEFVISFRGTEFARAGANGDPQPRTDDGLKDLSSLVGWGASIFADFNQGQMNAAYDAVATLLSSSVFIPGSTVTLTGHSLGGALAAVTALAHGLQAEQIDPAPFGNTRILELSFLRGGGALPADFLSFIQTSDPTLSLVSVVDAGALDTKQKISSYF